MRWSCAWILWVCLAMTGCRMVSSLSSKGEEKDVPFGKETQLAYFEGQAHLLKGDLEDAYAKFLSCAEAEPQEGAFHFQLGKIDLELTRHEAAELHFDRALECDPTNTWSHYFRGQARLAQGNGPGAEMDWRPYVASRPGDLEALMGCAEQLLAEGHVLPSLLLMDHYESNVGPDEDVRLEALRIVQQTSDNKGLGAFLDRALKDFPESDLFLLQHIRWQMSSGDVDQAEASLRVLTQRRPQWGLVQFEWAELATRRGDLEGALPHLKKAMSSDDVALESKLRVLLGYGVLAQEDPAFHGPYSTLLDLMMAHHSDEATVVEMACDWAYQNGRLEEALAWAQDLLALAPGAVESWTNLMAIRVDMGQWSEMAQNAEDAVARFPLNPLLHYYQGLALRETQRSKRAVEAYRSGLAVVLDSPVLEGALASALASALRDLSEWEASEEAFERSLRAAEDVFVLNNHAYYLATRYALNSVQGPSKLERALECSTRAVQLRPDEGNFMDTHAHVLYKLGRFEEALTWILDAQENGMAGDPVALEHEGDIRWSLGDHGGAHEAWQGALDAGGDPDVLTPKLQRP